MISEARARELLRELGPNALPEPARPSLLERLLRQLKSALIYLLLLALGLDLLSWLYEGAHSLPVEALAILAVLALNAGLGVAQEYRSENALAELKKLALPRAWVRRDDTLRHIDARELVPGDSVRLEAGDRVPADGVAANSESLATDESVLSGESLPLDKSDGSELHAGTLVVRGRAELEVTRTGPASTIGKLAASLSAIETGKTPLEQRIDELGTRIARYVALLSALLILGGLALDGWRHFSAIVMFAVAFGVAIVPESMPAMMTLALAFGVQRMARRNAVVRRLSAVEALGAVTVIASDKTGTLTSNKIVVEALHSEHEAEALVALTLANDAERAHDVGDPLERALLELASSRGTDISALRRSNPRVSSRPFDSRWKYMRVTVTGPDGELTSYLKGALEVVLERATLGSSERAEWLRRGDAAAGAGFKVLGLASAPGEAEHGLRFLGFVTMWDAPRPEARAAVDAAGRAGIRVLMLTGDHPETARAIGERVGIVSQRALTGAELEQLSEPELAAALAEVRIFSRLLPEHKLRIVAALQAQGEVVAMTGDGLNDAPALKRADVGVAMGERGSEVAREVADLVLLDDNFATIVTAVEEGRIIYQNILSFIRFTSSSNVALTVLVLGGAIGSVLFGLRSAAGAVLLPLTALQVLWINFLGDGPPALALSVDRNPNVMGSRPRARGGALLDARALLFILVEGALKGACGLGLLLLLPRLGASLAATATAVFLYESVAKLASAYPARKLDAEPNANPWLHVSIAAGVVLSVLCVLLGPLRQVLALGPLDGRTIVPLGLALGLTGAASELGTRLLSAKFAKIGAAGV